MWYNLPINTRRLTIRLQVSRTKNAASFYVVKTVYTNGKKMNKIHENLVLKRNLKKNLEILILNNGLENTLIRLIVSKQRIRNLMLSQNTLLLRSSLKTKAVPLMGDTYFLNGYTMNLVFIKFVRIFPGDTSLIMI